VGGEDDLDRLVEQLVDRVEEAPSLSLGMGADNQAVSEPPRFTPYTNILRNDVYACNPLDEEASFAWSKMTHLRVAGRNWYDPTELVSGLTQIIRDTVVSHVHPSFYHAGQSHVEIPFGWHGQRDQSRLVKIGVYPNKNVARRLRGGTAVIPKQY